MKKVRIVCECGKPYDVPFKPGVKSRLFIIPKHMNIEPFKTFSTPPEALVDYFVVCNRSGAHAVVTLR